MRQAFLQSGFGLPLQIGVDRRVYGVGTGGQAGDAIGLGLTAEIVDEVETTVAVRPLEDYELWGRKRLVLLIGGDVAVIFHPTQHVGETFSGARGVAVRIVEAWPLEQTGQHGALAEREILRGLAEIAAG